MRTVWIDEVEWAAVARVAEALEPIGGGACSGIVLQHADGRRRWGRRTPYLDVGVMGATGVAASLATTVLPTSFVLAASDLAAGQGHCSLTIGAQVCLAENRVGAVRSIEEIGSMATPRLREAPDRARLGDGELQLANGVGRDSCAVADGVPADALRRALQQCLTRPAGIPIRVGGPPTGLQFADGRLTVDADWRLFGGQRLAIELTTSGIGAGRVELCHDHLDRLLAVCPPRARIEVRWPASGDDIWLTDGEWTAWVAGVGVRPIGKPVAVATEARPLRIEDALVDLHPYGGGGSGWTVEIDTTKVRVVELSSGSVRTSSRVETPWCHARDLARVADNLNRAEGLVRYFTEDSALYAAIDVDDLATLADAAHSVATAADSVREPADAGPPQSGICANCGRLRRTNPETRCACQPPNTDLSPEARIPGGLCAMCGLTEIGAIGRWTRLLCMPCVRDAQALNQAAGHLVVPIGVHSLMNGIGADFRSRNGRPVQASSTDSTPVDRVLEAVGRGDAERFAVALRGLSMSIDDLRVRAGRTMVERCVELRVPEIDGLFPLGPFWDHCEEAGITRELAVAEFVAGLEGGR